jgi:hypothetical protein
MKMNLYIVKSAYRLSGGRLLTDHCSGAFLNEIKRSALLTVMLGAIVVLATGCSSTGTGFNASLISPIATHQQDANAEDDSSYQPAGSPAFSDLLGS